MKLNHNHLENVLNGDASAKSRAFSLNMAFDWHEHKRGLEWWETVFATLWQTGLLSVEAQSELKALA